jgi:hypothetical protein
MHGQKRLGLRPDNPAESTRLPSKDSDLGRQIRFLQHGEWALLRSCLRSDVHLLVDIALATDIMRACRCGAWAPIMSGVRNARSRSHDDCRHDRDLEE